MKIGLMPEGVTSRHILGAAALAGIGFTVSLFITGLAFDQSSLEADSKLGVMVGSLIAAAIGTILLRRANKVPGLRS
jgi:Na+/H+ antiporter NhaA